MSDVPSSGSDIMFTRIAKDLGNIKTQYNIAADLISAMKEAGESTAAVEQQLRDLEIKQDKWERMLKARGYQIE